MIASSLTRLAAARLRATARLIARIEEIIVRLVGAFAWAISLGFTVIYSPIRHRRTA